MSANMEHSMSEMDEDSNGTVLQQQADDPTMWMLVWLLAQPGKQGTLSEHLQPVLLMAIIRLSTTDFDFGTTLSLLPEISHDIGAAVNHPIWTADLDKIRADSLDRQFTLRLVYRCPVVAIFQLEPVSLKPGYASFNRALLKKRAWKIFGRGSHYPRSLLGHRERISLLRKRAWKILGRGSYCSATPTTL